MVRNMADHQIEFTFQQFFDQSLIGLLRQADLDPRKLPVDV